MTEVFRNFSETIGKVRFRKERFVLTKGGKPVAELGPADAVVQVRLGMLPTLLAELPHLEPEDAEHFALELDASRRAAGPTPPTAPWAS